MGSLFVLLAMAQQWSRCPPTAAFIITATAENLGSCWCITSAQHTQPWTLAKTIFVLQRTCAPVRWLAAEFR
jgi:hypothetical protein